MQMCLDFLSISWSIFFFTRDGSVASGISSLLPVLLIEDNVWTAKLKCSDFEIDHISQAVQKLRDFFSCEY
jgi:hypothetical protein